MCLVNVIQNQEKLFELAQAWGMEVGALLRKYATDSLAPAICINDGCDFIAEYEPDCRDGWCEECQEGTVVSAFVLAGIV